MLNPRRSTRARAALAVLPATLLIGVAGCGSSSSSSSSSSSAGGSGTPSSSSSSSSTPSGASSGLAAAQAYLTEAEKAPTSVGYSAPLPKKPPTGKLIAALETPVPIAKRVDDAREEAAAALGWRMKRIVVGSGAEDPAKAFAQGLDLKPDTITYSGYPDAAIAAGLARAKAQKVAVISESSTDPLTGSNGAGHVGDVRNLVSDDALGKMSAAKVIVDTQGKANVQLFGTSTFPILAGYNTAFKKWMGTWCPSCKVSFNDFQFTDIGTKLPGEVVSVLQRNPDTNYVVFGFGDATVGVEAAIKAAGIKVKFGGGIPGQAQYQALRDGTDAFWAQDTPPWTSWRETDLAARAIEGVSLDVANNAPLPVQLLTPDNIKTAAFDSQGFWIGYPGYKADFKKMWHVQ